MCVLSPRAGLW